MKMTIDNFIHNMEVAEHRYSERKEEFVKVMSEEFKGMIILRY